MPTTTPPERLPLSFLAIFFLSVLFKKLVRSFEVAAAETFLFYPSSHAALWNVCSTPFYLFRSLLSHSLEERFSRSILSRRLCVIHGTTAYRPLKFRAESRVSLCFRPSFPNLRKKGSLPKCIVHLPYAFTLVLNHLLILLVYERIPLIGTESSPARRPQRPGSVEDPPMTFTMRVQARRGANAPEIDRRHFPQLDGSVEERYRQPNNGCSSLLLFPFSFGSFFFLAPLIRDTPRADPLEHLL